MNKLIMYPLLVFATFILTCSFPTAHTKQAVTLSLNNDSLKIHNETSNKIYIMVVESDYAALINWAPLFSQPSINKGKSIEVKFDDIDNGKSESVKKGDRIIVYWWTDYYQTDKKINYESIIL